MNRIYLDYAAASPVNPKVLRAMTPYFSEIYYNPSALYAGAREAKKALEDARSLTAQIIGAKPSEIIFTAGGTESANLGIHGVMQRFPLAEIVISAIEHDAVLKPASNYNMRTATVDSYGRLEVESLQAQITDKTALVSVMLANNEIGTIQPIKDVVRLVSEIRLKRRASKNDLPIYVHIDACQAPLYLDVNVAKLGIDMMTLNGGKIYGPKQSGILYIKTGVKLKPIITGGGQEWGYRSGTENVAFAVGFARALELASRGRAERAQKMVELRDYFMTELENRFGAEITGHRTNRLAQNVHAIFPGTDNERVIFALDDAGVAVAAGSACSASSDTPSHVLLAMGRTEEEARSSIRFSFGGTTTKEVLVETLDLLELALAA